MIFFDNFQKFTKIICQKHVAIFYFVIPKINFPINFVDIKIITAVIFCYWDLEFGEFTY